jgi:hypothetical protein
MELSTSSNTLVITGNIKSINDFQDIKSTLDIMKMNFPSITIEMKDSISITSSVIGYLNKLVLKDKIKITIKVSNKQLLELFRDLHLIETFNVREAS